MNFTTTNASEMNNCNNSIEMLPTGGITTGGNVVNGGSIKNF